MLTLECLVFHAPGHRYFRSVPISEREAAHIVSLRSSLATHALIRLMVRVTPDDTIEDWRIAGPAVHRSLTSDWHDPDHTEPEVARLSLEADLTPKNQ